MEGSSLWLAATDARVIMGPNGEVTLYKSGDAALKTDNDLHAANIVVPEDGGLVDGVDVSALHASVVALQAAHDALDGVAVKSSEAGTQTLGTVTASSVSAGLVASSGAVRVGSATQCGAGNSGSIRWVEANSMLARRSFAEHLVATRALCCTATGRILIVAQCSAPTGSVRRDGLEAHLRPVRG